MITSALYCEQTPFKANDHMPFNLLLGREGGWWWSNHDIGCDLKILEGISCK